MSQRLRNLTPSPVSAASLTVRIDRAGMFDGAAEIVKSAGRSISFDRLATVAAGLPTLSRPVRAVSAPAGR
jgi:hypothetical protein